MISVLGQSNLSPEVANFLSEVWQSVREGHLCFEASSPIDLPPSLVEEGKDLYRNNLKNRFFPSSRFPQNFGPHSRLASRQWSLAPDQNFEDASWKIPDSSGCFGIFPKAPFVHHQGRYYLQKNWVFETYVLQQLHRLRSRANLPGRDLFGSLLEKDQTLSDEQKEKVLALFDSSFSILSGGPGTGKTYTAGAFVHLLASSFEKSRPYKVALAAPTGKAALHLQSSFLSRGVSGRAEVSSFTLHRLLSLKPGEVRLFSPKRLDFDLVIVDEASMMDISMLSHLLEAIGGDTRLVLMGDPDQLPPVEAGGLLKELSSLFGVFLTRSMRTKETSLQMAASAILQKDKERLLASLDWQESISIPSLIQSIEPLLSQEKIDPEAALAHYSRVRVLNALRQGPLGADEMNEQIQKEMNRMCLEGEWWAIPILVTANLPHRNLYNGTLGVLIGQKRGAIDLFSGKAYFAEDLKGQTPPPFEVSFVLSIHKSQGSEFDEVLSILPEGSERFGKEALYTAVTRAKRKVTLIGSLEIIEKMLQQQFCRSSGLISRWGVG